MKRLSIILLLLIPFCLAAQKKIPTDQEKKLNEFDLYAQKAFKQWEAPGAAVAIVKDGQVIFKKGYGVRELGRPSAVNTETLFACASTTKAMTAVCLGILVDEGKIKWNDPVSQHLPEFQLYDPFVTRDLKIRDLLIHNSGVGNTDFLWSLMDIPDDEVLRRMRLVKPTYSLRDGFIYQNIFYVAAGKVIEKVSGQLWESFVQERIFKPLKMSRTYPKMKYIKDDNYTKPHFRVDGKIQVIGYSKDDAVGPAGSVWSSINDMSEWTRCMLDSSKYNGGRLLKPQTWTEMYRPQTLVPPNEFYLTAKLTKPHWTTYGLGWFQHDYKGQKVNFHTGSLSGLTAIHGQLPDQKIGIYVFGNFDHAEVRHALMYKAFDLFALGGSRDWSTDFLALYSGLTESGKKELAKLEAARIPGTSPTLALEAYTGKYTDPLFGELTIQLVGSMLKVIVNNFESASLSHWNYDTFYGPWEKSWYGKVSATFTVNASGKIDGVNVGGMEFRKAE